MKKILIVDDEIDMLKSLEKILSLRKDFHVTLIDNGDYAIQLLNEQKFDLIITDLIIDNIKGIDILKHAIKQNSKAIVILLTGYGTIDASVQAMNNGAFDFIEKPFTSTKLFNSIDRAFEKYHTVFVEDSISDEDQENLKGIVIKNSKMKELIKIVKKIAPEDMNVLITGESGTGKELIARAFHNFSPRKTNPFVPVNCAALPENLFESELFGHEKGAFTGAMKTKPGLLEFAYGGTFFLDEISEISLHLQTKLLRLLEERVIRHVGGQNQIPIDVRIIAASNKNLEKLVEEGRFREDLFYRLETIHLKIPPLRERTDEILPIANHFLNLLCNQRNKIPIRFSPDAEEMLVEYQWPGNIRELHNIVCKSFYMCTNNVISRSDLPIANKSNTSYISNDVLNLPYKDAKNMLMGKFEIEYLSYHLKKNKGNISKTADSCCIDRRTIHRLINQFHLIYKE